MCELSSSGILLHAGIHRTPVELSALRFNKQMEPTMNTTTKQSSLLSSISDRATELMDFSRYDPSQYIEGYKGRAGYTCLWIPPELLRMGGYQPVLLRGKFKMSDGNGFECCRCSSIEDFFTSNSIPDLKFLAIADTCPQIMKTAFRITQTHDLLLFCIHEPKGQDDESLGKYIHHLNWLRESVSNSIPESKLEDSFIKAYAAYCRIRELLEVLRQRNNLPSELYYLLQAVTQTALYELTIPFLEDVVRDTETLETISGCPIMIVGGALGLDEIELAEMISSSGGIVAADLLCNSGRSSAPPGKLRSNLSFESLALEYFNRLPCMPVQPNRRFYDHLDHMLEDRNIRGVIFYKPDNCTSYEIEQERIMWKSPVPVLLLDGDFMRLAEKEKKKMISDFIGNISL